MIAMQPSLLKETKPHEYLVRFLLGGLVTVAAGLIADHFGPVLGGLFLAFPAIFPAAATIIEKHDRKKKEHAGLPAGKRGRMVAGVDAGGTVLGTIGLAVFALFLWRWLPRGATWVVLMGALACWMMVSAGLWWIRRLL
jgi:MFS family permease